MFDHLKELDFIHCKTQEEYDFINEYVGLHKSNFNDYKENTVIYPKDFSYGSLAWSKKNFPNNKCYQASEFMKQEFDITKVAVRGDGGKNIELFKEFFKGYKTYVTFEGNRDTFYLIKDNLVHCRLYNNNNNLTVYDSIQEAIEARDKSFVLPELWYCKPENKEDAKVLGKWFDDNKEGTMKCFNYYQNNFSTILINGLSNNGFGYYKNSNHVEITFDQFKKFVLKETNMNNTNRFPFKLKPKDAQTIIDVSCVNWKPKLANAWGTNIVQGIDIEITESDYKNMRKACTSDQHKLFDTIFGKDIEEIELKSGQVWKHESGNFHVISKCRIYDKIYFTLTGLYCDANIWSNSNVNISEVFGSSKSKFTYVGMLNDVLTINE